MCPLMRTSSSACNREAMGMSGVFTDLLATRSWAKGCQMRPSAKAAEKPEDKADPKESSEARNERPGPIQAEQLSQLLTQIQGSQLREQLPHLGGLISTFLGPAALEAVFPVLEALAKTQSVQSEESEIEQKKAKEDIMEEEKASQNIEAEKEKSEDMDVEEKTDSDFEVIPAISPPSSIYPTLPMEEQARLWKTNPMDPTNVDQEDKEDTESAKSADKKRSEQNDTEDQKVAGSLAKMKAMGFSDDGGWLSNLLMPRVGTLARFLT